MTYHGPNPGRTRRTFTKEQLDASRAAWDSGDFSDEWRDWRHLAAMQAGIIDAPEGTKWDSWADDQPSERALLVRAIREQPTALRAALLSGKVYSWGQVIRLVLQGRDRLGEEADRREHEWDVIRRDRMTKAGDIAQVIADSVRMAESRVESGRRSEA